MSWSVPLSELEERWKADGVLSAVKFWCQRKMHRGYLLKSILELMVLLQSSWNLFMSVDCVEIHYSLQDETLKTDFFLSVIWDSMKTPCAWAKKVRPLFLIKTHLLGMTYGHNKCSGKIYPSTSLPPLSLDQLDDYHGQITMLPSCSVRLFSPQPPLKLEHSDHTMYLTLILIFLKKMKNNLYWGKYLSTNYCWYQSAKKLIIF